MHTILVADDSVTIQKAVEIAFDKEPFQVVKVGSGEEAIARAKELKPHVVLADHLMPDRTGYEVAEALRGDPQTESIPVLILSGSSAPYDEARATSAGVVGHIPKPFDCQSLLDRVRNLLGVAATPLGTAMPAGAAAAPASGMPRPPGLPGLAGSMPRPPGGLGLPRPPGGGLAGGGLGFGGSGNHAGATAAAPMTSPLSPRTTTPVPARDLDPFGLSGTLSTPPSPAPASAPPTASAPSGAENPFATSTSIGAAGPTPLAPTPAVAPAPMSSPPSISSGGIGLGEEKWQAKSSDMSFDISFDDGSAPRAPAQPAAPPRPSAPSSGFAGRAGAETEFLEVGDIEVGDIGGAGEAEPAAAQPAAPPAAAPPAVAADAITAAAVDAVVEQAAPAIAATGNAPSREALAEEARQIVERIAWEVVPELAEVIIREEIQRLLKSR
jgi:CheY-like chemotaxis protein